MSFGFGIGDITSTIKLAWHLYKNCFQVARDAPHAFKSLKQELANTHSSLLILKEECASSNSTLLSAANRIDTLNGLVAQYQDALNALNKHSKKYEKLGDKNRSALKKFWEGVKWSAEASDLDVMRNKLVYLNGILGLVLISSGNSSLQRIQSISQKVEQGVSDIKGIIKKSQATVPTISAIESDRIFALSLSEKFIEYAQSQRNWSAIGVDQWISAGTWWLLKSQANIQKRLSSSAPAVDDSFQWYTDLIKAAWILIDIISRHPQLDLLDSGTAIRVDILVETIKDELQKVDKLGLTKPNFEQIQTCDLAIWEGSDKAPALRPSGGDSRSGSGWAVEDEHIMFQQFAQYRASQHETTVSCVILLLLHKKDRRGRIMLTDQNWVARCSLPVADDMRMRVEDRVFFVGNQEIHLSTPHDAMTLHVTIEALNDYVWRCPLCDRNMGEVIALSALFAVKFGYGPVIESMPEEIPDGQDEIKGSSPKQSFPLRARQLARSTLQSHCEPEFGTKSIFLWALSAHQYDILILVLEFKGILVALDEKNVWSSISGAVSGGHIPFIRHWLLELDHVSGDGWDSIRQSAFLQSISGGHLNVVNAFLEMGILNKLVCSTKANDIPLLCATTHGHLPIVHRLLEAAASVDVKDDTGETPLIKATSRGQLSIVDRLLQAGAEVNAKDNYWKTPLILAAGCGHLDIVVRLLQAGAEANAKDNYWKTPLTLAAGCGRLDIVDRLLQAGAEVNAKDNYWKTPLILAAGCGQLSIVDRLLQAGAEVNAKEDYGKTSLTLAADCGHLDIVDRLLQAGAEVDVKDINEGVTPLFRAANNGHLDIVNRLLQAGADVNAKNNYRETLLFRVADGHLDIVDRLLQAGAEVDVKDDEGVKLLFRAANHGHLDIVNRLLQAGADVNAKTSYRETPLFQAASHGHLDIVDRLLQAGAKVDAKNHCGQTPLLGAAICGHLDIVDRLLQVGAEVNAKDNSGKTVLWAPIYGHLDIVNRLLRAGADVNAKDNGGQTPLIRAAHQGRLNSVDGLLQAGADVNEKDNDGKTPLILAAGCGHLDTVDRLLRAGADVNAKDNGGQTPLILAAYQGHLDTIYRLLQAGAEVNVKDNSGYTPLLQAANWGCLDSVDRLLQAGAEVNTEPNHYQFTPTSSLREILSKAGANFI